MAPKSNIDLDGMSFQELTALIDTAESKRREKQDEAKQALKAEFEQRASLLGMSFEDLRGTSPRAASGGTPGRASGGTPGRASGGTPGRAATERKVRKDAGTPVAPKFRGPDGATWSGRGRKPGWLTRAEAQGSKAEEFRI